MRGEVCVGLSSLLSLTSILLLIFSHAGQSNTSTIPRGISTMTVDMTGFLAAYQSGANSSAAGLFNNTAPIGLGLGLKPIYKWGFYNYCAYSNSKTGSCASTGLRVEPLKAILADTPPAYQVNTRVIIASVQTSFSDNDYLGETSAAATVFILMGTISAIIALLTGMFKHRVTFTAAAFFSIFGAFCLLVGGACFASVVNRAKSVNGITLQAPNAPSITFPLGISVSMGNALPLIWVAFALLALSAIPYVIVRSTYTRRGY